MRKFPRTVSFMRQIQQTDFLFYFEMQCINAPKHLIMNSVSKLKITGENESGTPQKQYNATVTVDTVHRNSKVHVSLGYTSCPHINI